MNGIIEYPQTANQIVTPMSAADNQARIDEVWWQLFDIAGAVKQLDLHLTGLGSDDTPEQHTRDAYERDMKFFLNWAGPKLPAKELRKSDLYTFVRNHPTPRFPSSALLKEYMGDLKRDGMKPATINRKMAPVRLWVKALRKQFIPARGETRDFIADLKDHMDVALDERAPKVKNQDGALYQHGTRLQPSQVKALWKYLVGEAEGGDLLVLRDLALMYVGFNTGLRNAELRRLTLGNIRQGKHTWEIWVRRKRGKMKAVALDETGHTLIMRWVEAYNDGLEVNDPRRIGKMRQVKDKYGKLVTEETKIFQPLWRGGHYTPLGVRHYDPFRGLGKSSLEHIVEKRSVEVWGVKISPHDMRRSMAAMANDSQMPIQMIQHILGHDSVATTQGYIGEQIDLSKTLLSNYVKWGLQLAG